MSHQIVDLECPGCGAAVSTEMQTCPHCYRQLVIRTINNIVDFTPLDLNKQANSYKKALSQNPESAELNMSVAFCYMKLKLYDKAIPCFEKALEENFDNADAYYCAAIALLRGKKAFLAPRDVIDKIIEYIDAANMIEPKGIFYYFLAYIKYDYFERKYLNSKPSYKDCLGMATQLGLSQTDVRDMYNLLEVERPAQL